MQAIRCLRNFSHRNARTGNGRLTVSDPMAPRAFRTCRNGGLATFHRGLLPQRPAVQVFCRLSTTNSQGLPTSYPLLISMLQCYFLASAPGFCDSGATQEFAELERDARHLRMEARQETGRKSGIRSGRPKGSRAGWMCLRTLETGQTSVGCSRCCKAAHMRVWRHLHKGFGPRAAQWFERVTAFELDVPCGRTRSGRRQECRKAYAKTASEHLTPFLSPARS